MLLEKAAPWPTSTLRERAPRVSLYMGYLRKAINAVAGVPTAEPQQI